MPANLDANQRRVILCVSCFTTLVVLTFTLKAHLVTVPRLKRSLAESPSFRGKAGGNVGVTSKPGMSVFVGCLASMALMAVATAAMTIPITAQTNDLNDGSGSFFSLYYSDALPSSINFCEEDFRHHHRIAEPANVASSLASYVPLGLLGLFGPSARQRHRGGSARRFDLVHVALVAIGIGSVLLHTLLTASAQGGDELPMLWYTAAASYCTMDVACARRGRDKASLRPNEGGDGNGDWGGHRWLLRCTVAASAVVATIVYVAMRDNFVIFYLIFALYVQALVAGVVWITLFLKWEEGPWGRDEGNVFLATVLFPLGYSVAWLVIAAMWTWVSEMLFCNAVMRGQVLGDYVAPWVWNRVVHPMWHFESGMLAWLLGQLLLAAHGMQRGWGVPTLQWFGTPYVKFALKET